MTRCRVRSLTPSKPARTRETVAVDTPAEAETSFTVALFVDLDFRVAAKLTCPFGMNRWVDGEMSVIVYCNRLHYRGINKTCQEDFGI